jgi:YHS domain-containing protein
MNAMRTWWHAASVLVVAAFLAGAGCKKEEQPAPPKPAEGETVGAKIDEALDAAKDTAEDTVEKAGDAVDAAAGAVSDVIKDAKEELTGEAKAEVVAILARADALDGAEDKVITKCPACNLAMDGSDENTIVVEGYTMHFCTPACKEKFDKDPLKAILAMQFPEEGETE